VTESDVEPEPGSFLLGDLIDEAGERTEPFVYESSGLVTHGVVVGMTGSGKTGLGIDLVEEALLSGIPCLVIDPKGDMGNLRLVFPDLQPSDFAPWVDPVEAEQSGRSVEEQAAATAETWAEGLSSWGMTSERMARLRDGSRVTIYTPGSTAGVPLDVLGSLQAPDLSWDEHDELLRDEIEGFVSSLLVLAGIEADPVSSPEHILLATIVETEWRAGRDLDLGRLVAMVPRPPLKKLGVFPLDEFYPEAKRTELARSLNALLASPSFASWLEGEPLDIDHLLVSDGSTPAAVVYLAHLSEPERQFVVTLLLAKLVTWMRSRSGTGSLQTLVYMDEVFGFAPPVAEPPAKKQILTILKQARAYGVGMVLSTQNPVDLDYKAMSNAGTWMIGRLQTARDKDRVLEGLADAAGDTDLAAISDQVSNLDKRQFVVRRAGSHQPVRFTTRWAMSFLAGPLDRSQVTALTRSTSSVDADDETGPPGPGPASPPAPRPDPSGSDQTATVPAPPAVATESATLDPAAPWASEVEAVPAGGRWRAIGMATAHLFYDDRYAEVEHEEDFTAVIDPLGAAFDPSTLRIVDHDSDDVAPGPPSAGSFILPDAPVDSESYWRDLGRDVRSHLVRERSVSVWKNPELSLYSRVGETREAFTQRCATMAEAEADAELAALRQRYAKRIDRVRDQISRADRRVGEIGSELTGRQGEEVVSGVGDLLGALLGGRSASGALRRASARRSDTRRREADLGEARADLDEEQQELADLESDLASEVDAIVDEWHEKAAAIELVEIGLEEDDVDVGAVALVWVPTD
jgi:DNA helicase HerA-like ATPase